MKRARREREREEERKREREREEERKREREREEERKREREREREGMAGRGGRETWGRGKKEKRKERNKKPSRLFNSLHPYSCAGEISDPLIKKRKTSI